MGFRLLKTYLFNFTYLQIYFLDDSSANKNYHASNAFNEVKECIATVDSVEVLYTLMPYINMTM